MMAQILMQFCDQSIMHDHTLLNKTIYTGQDKDQDQKVPRPRARQSLTWLPNSVG